MVITARLEAQHALSDYDRDDYFWSGIRPLSLRDVLENELRACDYWTDLTLPPPNERVMEVAVKFLNRAIYHLREVSMHLKQAKGKKKRRGSLSSESESSDDEVSDLSVSSSEEELSSEDEDEESEEKKKDR